MQIQISKAILKGRQIAIGFNEVFHTENGPSQNKVSNKEYADLVTEDLINAFNSLKSHLVCICQFQEYNLAENIISIEEKSDDLILDKIFVTGFVLSGSDESKGVSIIGQRECWNKTLNITTPVIVFSEENYPHSNNLEMNINLCVSEILEFMEGKVAQRQTTIEFAEFEQAPVIEINTESEENPKKKTRTKKSKTGFIADLSEMKLQIASSY